MPAIFAAAAFAVFLALTFVAWRRYHWAAEEASHGPADTCRLGGRAERLTLVRLLLEMDTRCLEGYLTGGAPGGEMGGRGEGNWDGKPMAQLVREVMENADTLEEAVEIMRKSPRTCE